VAQPATAPQFYDEEAPTEPEPTELERRLGRLKWPAPPPGARERGLEALRGRLEDLMAPERDRASA
jgi:hypothetical protein